MRKLVVASVVALFVAGDAAHAQTVAAPQRANVFSVHPAGSETSYDLAFEYERRVGRAITLGAATDLGTFGRGLDGRLRSAAVGARYFFSGDAWRGLSLGVSIGSRQARNFGTYRLVDQPATVQRSTSAILLDYHWLMGADRRLYLGAGAGMEATWRSREELLRVGVPLARPTARLSLGVAF